MGSAWPWILMSDHQNLITQSKWTFVPNWKIPPKALQRYHVQMFTIFTLMFNCQNPHERSSEMIQVLLHSYESTVCVVYSNNISAAASALQTFFFVLGLTSRAVWLPYALLVEAFGSLGCVYIARINMSGREAAVSALSDSTQDAPESDNNLLHFLWW